MSIPKLIAVIHLPALPGSPGNRLSTDEIASVAADEARELQARGFEAIIVENFGDVPFYPSEVPPITIAAMTACTRAVRTAVKVPLGVNVLRNDARAALAVAVASGAQFIRVNVHAGAKVTDQGVVETQAHLVLRERAALGANHISIFADANVKHAAPLGARDIEDEAEDLVERGLADAVLVTGTGTGKAVDLSDLDRVRKHVAVPVLAASGVTTTTLSDTLARCDGVIVGSALRQNGKAGTALDPVRVKSFASAFRSAQHVRG